MTNETRRISLFMIILVASLGGFMFGFDMAVISGVLPLVKQQFTLTAAQQGWFVSSALLGCIIGVSFSGELSDRLGRKKPLFITDILFVLSALGCAMMPTLSGVIVSRLMGGIGIGIASNVVPLYISEIAPAKIRGRLVTYYQFAITFGILVAYLSNAALLNGVSANELASNATGFGAIFNAEVWRGMLGLGVIPALLFLFGLLIIPESPRWLIQKGRSAEGVLIISRITQQPIAEIEAAQAKLSKQTEKISYKDLLKPSMRKALLIGVLLPLFSQFSGINAIIYYGPSILSNAGVSLSNSLLSQVIFGVANVLFTIIAIWKVDSWGRRPLYLYGTAGATICLILTGYCFYAGVTGGVLLLISVLGFLACFAFSIGPLKFVIAAEIFPSAIRGRALAISIMVMWVADTIAGQITPMLLKEVGSAGTFWFFAFFCLIAFFVVYKLLPETKGKSLEEIESNWKKEAALMGAASFRK